MSKYLFSLLFLIVLVTPFFLRRAVGTASPSSANAAATPLLIITPNGEPIRREFADGFNEWHRKKYGTTVDVRYLSFGGASDIVKYFTSTKATYQQTGTYKVDLAWGGGDVLFDLQLKKPGYLQPVTLDSAVMAGAFPKPDLAGVPLYDRAKPPSWFGTALSSFGICYNRDVLRYLGLPDVKTWRDLANPRYAGWIIMADPTRSSSAKAAFLSVVERAMADASAAGKSEDDGWADGMGLLRQISANCRTFTDSSGVVPNLIASGDVATGMTIDFYARSEAAAVGTDRMGYVEPINATVLNPDPIAMIKGAEHPELAKQFITFVLSEEGQRLWMQKAGTKGGPRETALWREPIMPAIYELPADLLTESVNPYRATSTFNKSMAREQTFGIIGELLQFSCMDVLDELKETRQVILAHNRADLDARLGKFPFGQAEAIAREKRWAASTPLQQLDLARQWTAEFRAEYANLRDLAQQ
jgi:ABC-type Fe3+ transport system substrate-binding protein